MGMTIEKAIDRLEDLHFEQDNWEDGELTEDCLLNKEALRQAIDIIHKYQQIVQIYQKWNDVNDFSYNQAMQKIGEVLEDDNSTVDNSDMRSSESNTEYCSDSGTGEEQQEPRECLL